MSSSSFKRKQTATSFKSKGSHLDNSHSLSELNALKRKHKVSMLSLNKRSTSHSIDQPTISNPYYGLSSSIDIVSSQLNTKRPMSASISKDFTFFVKDFNVFYNYILKHHQHGQALILQDVEPGSNFLSPNTPKPTSLSIDDSMRCQFKGMNNVKVNFHFWQKALGDIRRKVEVVKRSIANPLFTPSRTRNFGVEQRSHRSYSFSIGKDKGTKSNDSMNSARRPKAGDYLRDRAFIRGLLRSLSVYSFFDRVDDDKGNNPHGSINQYDDRHSAQFRYKLRSISSVDLKEYYEKLKGVGKKIDAHSSLSISHRKAVLQKEEQVRKKRLVSSRYEEWNGVKSPEKKAESVIEDSKSLSKTPSKKTSKQSDREIVKGNSVDIEDEVFREEGEDAYTCSPPISKVKANSTNTRPHSIKRQNSNMRTLLNKDTNNKALLSHLIEKEKEFTIDQPLQSKTDSAETDLPPEVTQKLLLLKQKKDIALRCRSTKNGNEQAKDDEQRLQKAKEEAKDQEENLNQQKELHKEKLGVIKLNQDINYILSDSRLFSGQDQSIVDEFREKIESLKAFSREEYNCYLSDNLAFIQEEIKQIKQSRDHELRVNMFVKALNRSRIKVKAMKSNRETKIRVIDACNCSLLENGLTIPLNC